MWYSNSSSNSLSWLKNLNYKKLNFLDVKTKSELLNRLQLLQIESCEDSNTKKVIWLNLFEGCKLFAKLIQKG